MTPQSKLTELVQRISVITDVAQRRELLDLAVDLDGCWRGVLSEVIQEESDLGSEAQAASFRLQREHGIKASSLPKSARKTEEG